MGSAAGACARPATAKTEQQEQRKQTTNGARLAFMASILTETVIEIFI